MWDHEPESVSQQKRSQPAAGDSEPLLEQPVQLDGLSRIPRPDERRTMYLGHESHPQRIGNQSAVSSRLRSGMPQTPEASPQSGHLPWAETRLRRSRKPRRSLTDGRQTGPKVFSRSRVRARALPAWTWRRAAFCPTWPTRPRLYGTLQTPANRGQVRQRRPPAKRSTRLRSNRRHKSACRNLCSSCSANVLIIIR